MRFVGYPELRHPVQLYEIAILILISIAVMIMSKKAVRHRWQIGLVGSIFFLLLSIFMFFLEFFKESRLIFHGFTFNQWILLALFCESLGVIYVRGGGRMLMRSLGTKLGGFYGQISKKHSS
jgi:prolipoprotein diacylglyceryltransferase